MTALSVKIFFLIHTLTLSQWNLRTFAIVLSLVTEGTFNFFNQHNFVPFLSQGHVTGCVRLDFFIQVYIGRAKITFTSVGWKKSQRGAKTEIVKCLPKKDLHSEIICSLYFFFATKHISPKILYAELHILWCSP